MHPVSLITVNKCFLPNYKTFISAKHINKIYLLNYLKKYISEINHQNGSIYGPRNCQKFTVSGAINLKNGPDIFLEPEIYCQINHHGRQILYDNSNCPTWLWFWTGLRVGNNRNNNVKCIQFH